MAQDTHLFSVSRPRQTLGAINLNSGLPQPASALKRSSSISGFKESHLNAPATIQQHARSQSSSSRMSMMPSRPPQPNFTRSSSGTNLNDMSKSVQRPRMSYAPGAGNPLMTPYHGAQPTMALGTSQSAMQRRSSVWSAQQRPSNGPAMGHQQSFFVQAPLPSGVPVDKRRLRDRQVQNTMAQELEQYFSDNNFMHDMNHQLQPNAFRSPTQKDFNLIFQWLYKRIDPAYVFQKSIDNEVPAILNQLRYPFAKSITKSQLSAVGGQNWYNLLGMLHWLMQLALMMDGYVNARYDSAILEEGIDVSGDRIIYRFLSSAYQTWLGVPEDATEEELQAYIAPHREEMAAEFEAGNAGYLDELAILEAENEALRKQIEAEEEAMPDLQKQEEYARLIDEDIVKFEAYVKKQQDKIARHEERARLLQEEMQKTEGQITDALREKGELQEAVDRQGITIQQIDAMNSERQHLQDDSEGVRQRLEQANLRMKEREQEASAKLAHLESLARDYNSLCYSVGIREEEFELVVRTNDSGISSSQFGSSIKGGDRLLADSETGYHPARILNLDMRGKIKGHIISLRREVDKRRTAAKEQDEQNRRILFDIASAIDDKKHEIEALRHRVLSVEEEHEKTKEVTTMQRHKSEAEIEKTEKELARIRGGLTDDIQYWQQREMNVEIEYEQLSLQADALREELHTKIENMLDYVIKFKVHIQSSLEAYETFVDEEVDQELAYEEELDKAERKGGQVAVAKEGFEKFEPRNED